MLGSLERVSSTGRTCGRIGVSRSCASRTCLHLNVAGQRERLVLGELLALLAVATAEGVLGGQHLDDQDAHVPPVGLLAVVAVVTGGVVQARGGFAGGARGRAARGANRRARAHDRALRRRVRMTQPE